MAIIKFLLEFLRVKYQLNLLLQKHVIIKVSLVSQIFLKQAINKKKLTKVGE